MSKVSRNVIKLYEAANCFIRCDYCDNEIRDYDSDGLVMYADEEGWVVNRADKVKCPKCAKKMKRK